MHGMVMEWTAILQRYTPGWVNPGAAACHPVTSNNGSHPTSLYTGPSGHMPSTHTSSTPQPPPPPLNHQTTTVRYPATTQCPPLPLWYHGLPTGRSTPYHVCGCVTC